MSIEQEKSTAENQDIIAIKDLNKWYGEFHVLKDINLQVKKARRSSSVVLPGRASQP